MQPGYATPEGTQAWRHHHKASIHESQWRQLDEVRISPVGLGTYLGAPDAATDNLYEQALLHFLSKGGNLIDTAVNYRWQASERAVGRALVRAFAAGVPRESIFVSTKGGFVPGDIREDLDIEGYLRTRLLESGVIQPDEVVAGCHCISPAYLQHQIEISRSNLGLETIDLYYLHNPEMQLDEISQDIFFQRVEAAFAALESAVACGKIRCYGCATWNGFRLPTTDKTHINLETILEIARGVAGERHHFLAIQAPFNLAMPEAMIARTQAVKSDKVPLLQAAERLEIVAMCGAPLMQSQLLRKPPGRLAGAYARYESDAARLLAFVINAPGVLAALCGMKHLDHVTANWEAINRARMSPAEWMDAISRLR
jgi:aryl-alcohol dehydrogenase-like predicted oxidoreductase